MSARIGTNSFAFDNPDRYVVFRVWKSWQVWLGGEYIDLFYTHEEAINFATEEARFQHFWWKWYSKVPNATIDLARDYWKNHMTKGERNAW